MRRSYLYVVALACLTLVIFASGCSNISFQAKGEAFPAMYEEHPRAILVLPPINESTAADAKLLYAATIAEPLTNAGYYVYPPPVINEILQMEGAFDTETLAGTPLSTFREAFGADAVLFITIKSWEKVYVILAGSIKVALNLELKSTHTGRTLWSYDRLFIMDTSGSGGSGGILAQIVATAINTAITDYSGVALSSNFVIMQEMPYGAYHPMYNRDQQEKTVVEDKPRWPGRVGMGVPPAVYYRGLDQYGMGGNPNPVNNPDKASNTK